MSEFSSGIDPDTSERLLDGARTPVTGQGPVGELLARAAAPGRPEEVAGAAAALAAFRAAYPQPLAHKGRTLRRALALKVGAIAAALTVGGVAFAAHSGVLPHPFPTVSPTSPPSSAPGATPARSSLPSPSGTPTALPSASAGAVGNLHGLCRAFLATADKHKPKATDGPMYAALIAAAGGRDLADYCTALIDAGGGRPSGKPGSGPSPKPGKSHPAPSAKKSKNS
ncbi:hypothetical protein Cme02nite_10240 [Catellatospora methionotrophica]|uniref:Uncharacterized protein n=1 Tax=Catellatospora methionotrophica TaxID=121620 RepID=A0A8J3PD51_9ACTN|nr:hypothetical protein [Catellatospora methionotrophica]GIG12692.1 hypothetical protein Cme02nite_10240 [Catellatospora methionotrophica]